MIVEYNGTVYRVTIDANGEFVYDDISDTEEVNN
jgi:hypothetical protein